MSAAAAPAATPAARSRSRARPAYFETGWTGGHNPWAIALVVTLATFMEVLDTSIANVSLPHIAGNLSATQDESTWVLTSYLVSNAIVLPMSGWMASKIGRKRFYMSCVALFTVSSFLCGLAPNLMTLVACRILQGIGGGGLGPSEQSILADTFPPAKRGMAFAVYGMAVVLAPAIGPTLGGYITDNFSWRWVFFINVPVGILSLILANRMVTDPPHLAKLKEQTKGIDVIGLGLLVVRPRRAGDGLRQGVRRTRLVPTPRSSSARSIVAVVSLSLVLLRRLGSGSRSNPVVDVSLYKNRNFAAANVMMLTLGNGPLRDHRALALSTLQVLMGYTPAEQGRNGVVLPAAWSSTSSSSRSSGG